MFKDKKLICFDLDGTLIDSVGIWNQVDAQLIRDLAQFEVDLADVQQQRDVQLKRYRQSADPYLEYCAYLSEKYAFQLDKAEVKARRYAISRDFLDHIVELKSHADVVIHTLKQAGIIVSLATTTSLYNIQRYKENNTKINRKIDFERDFALILTRENVQKIKPHPEVYLKTLAHFNLQPQEMLIIEDSLIGVEAALAAGIEVIAIYDEYSKHEWTEIQNKAHFSVKDYVKLIDLFHATSTDQSI